MTGPGKVGGKEGAVVDSDKVEGAASPPREEKVDEEESQQQQRPQEILGSLTPAESVTGTEEDESDLEGARSRSASSCSNSSGGKEEDQDRDRPGAGGRTVTRTAAAPTSKTAIASKLLVNSVTLIASFLALALVLLGSYSFFRLVEENKCDMTWMPYRPEYVPISISPSVTQRYPHYQLYTYAEGDRHLSYVSKPDFKFSGIPVLYIPGNAGSFKQVRSLASVSLWKYIDSSTPFHFDYFTVNLNEEFSALYGYSLRRQVDYVREAVAKITSLYEDHHKVVLIGHSMGGVIAKAVAVSNLEEEEPLSNLIVTLSTPHLRSVVILDPEIDNLYHAINRNWTLANDAKKMTLVSIAGGDRDYLVPPKLTRSDRTLLHISTTQVSGVWASSDHLCIVWCRQLVVTLVRALFDLVELHPRNKYYYLSEDHSRRREVFTYHLEQRWGGKSHSRGGSDKPYSLLKSFEQVEVTQGIHCTGKGSPAHYLRFTRSFLEQNGTGEDNHLLILTTNTKEKQWLLGCVEEDQEGRCLKAQGLSHLGRIIPHIRRRRKMASLSMRKVKPYSSVLIRMDPHPFKTCVMLENYRESERTLPLGTGTNVISSSGEIFYNLTVEPRFFGEAFAHSLAWRLKVLLLEAKSCPDRHNLLAHYQHGPLGQWNFLKNESLIVKYSDWTLNGSSVQLYLEPGCSYEVKVTLAWKESAGQMFRLVARLLPSFYAGVLMMALYFQEEEEWKSFHLVVLSNAYRLSVVPGVVVGILLQFLPTDWPQMVAPREYSILLPFLCFLTAYALALAVSTSLWYLLITGGTAIHQVLIRLLSSSLGPWVPRLFSSQRFNFSNLTDHVTEAAVELSLTRFPLTVAILLLSLSFATCGSLGIGVGLILYLVKLFKMYEDLLEDLLKAKIANIKDGLSPMNFHVCCWMLWLVVAGLNLPGLLHWVRSGEVKGQGVEWDMSMYVGLMLIPSVAVLWQDFVPKMEPTIWFIHRHIFYGIGLACVLWGTHRLYVTSLLITFVFFTMALCQLVSVVISSLQARIRQEQERLRREEEAAAASPLPPSSPNRGG